jgi:hypothetical protein
MFKLAVIGATATVAFAAFHPVNQDMVDEIRAKADTW